MKFGKGIIAVAFIGNAISINVDRTDDRTVCEKLGDKFAATDYANDEEHSMALSRVVWCHRNEEYAKDERLPPVMKRAAKACFRYAEKHYVDCREIYDQIQDYISGYET